MKGCRKCRHVSAISEDDSIYHMAEVNKGAQWIMSDSPDQLTAMFTRTIVFTLVFVFIIVTVTYLVLMFDTPLTPTTAVLMAPAGLLLPEGHSVVDLTTPEFCSTMFKNIHSPGHRRHVEAPVPRLSRLMELDVGTDDVHYVLANSTCVPWMFTCSLESVLRAVGNRSRVNVFIVNGTEFEQRVPDEQCSVPLSSSLAELTATYGADRMNVVNVSLEECLEFSPFRGADLSKSPGLAEFAVQLALLWQFGGTALASDVLAVRGQVYRASGAAVEYGDRTISSPAACHAFVYEAMAVCAARRGGGPFTPIDGRKILDRAAARRASGGIAVDARAVADGTVCRDGAAYSGGDCYYAVADRVMTKPWSRVYGLCPVAGQAACPVLPKTTDTADRKADDDGNRLLRWAT